MKNTLFVLDAIKHGTYIGTAEVTNSHFHSLKHAHGYFMMDTGESIEAEKAIFAIASGFSLEIGEPKHQATLLCKAMIGKITLLDETNGPVSLTGFDYVISARVSL